MKKIVHVISHSHLDREWYMPLVEHRMYLVNLIDNIIKLSKDERFNSFHLDGQIIPLEDYFLVKPENKEVVLKLIKDKKLRIGPFYVMQDAFLISSESNLRNIQVGIHEAKSYGIDSKEHMYIGYFPDTFGNPGQMPQILKRANIDIAYFGRGVKATGFNNAVLDDYSTKYSELKWLSKDNSSVLAILFANWYCNANEIPCDIQNAKKFWDQKLSDCEKFASTRHLLMMNGCDHQPLQMDVLDSIDVANSIYDDYEFIHSNLEDYSNAVKSEVKDLENIKGELRSQYTDGWYTLQSTNSNRIYLKVENKKCEYLLEEQVEPLLTSIYDKDDYPVEKIHYAWKTLISNHPHDSICGCGIDSVHDGMEERFKQVRELCEHLTNKALYDYSLNVDTTEYTDEYLFTLHNITQYEGVKETEVVIDLKKIKFSEMNFNDGYKLLSSEKMPNSVEIYFDNELVYKTNIEDKKVVFDYDIPDNSFRVAYWTKRVKFNAFLPMKAFSRKTFVAKFSYDKIEDIDDIIVNNNYISNGLVDILINDNGTFNINDFKSIGYFEDCGDIGNEYIFKKSLGNNIYSNENKVEYEIKREKNKVKIIFKDKLIIPKNASKDLLESQNKMEDVPKRQVSRSTEMVILNILKTVEICSGSRIVKMNLEFENIAKDHRLRLIIPTGIKSDYVYPESIFEIAKRNIVPSDNWINPDNSQNLNRFVNMRQKNRAITVGTVGIAEYEVFDDNKLALTIGRYTGELGDWGYFNTIGSQGLRKYNLTVYIDVYDDDNHIKSIHNILEARKVYLSNQIYPNQKGRLKNQLSYNIDAKDLIVSAFKRNYKKDKIIRLCNYTDKEIKLDFDIEKELDILEQNEIKLEKTVKSFEIRTFGLE